MFFLIIAAMLLTMIGPGSARDLDGRYASSPHRAWFLAQRVPDGERKGQLCCSVADGQDAQEDIREGQYWTQWDDYPWMLVPREAVLSEPNPRGHATVWWFLDNGKPVIRCFAPGSGL